MSWQPKYVPGYKIGGVTILTRSSSGIDAIVSYRCDCGAVTVDAQVRAIYVRSRMGRTRCFSCRESYTRLIKMRCKVCGCGIRRIASTGGQAACDDCRRLSGIATRKIHGNAHLGRVCAGCDRTDVETGWSGLIRACSGCARQGDRNGWCPCGSPLRKGAGGPGSGRARNRQLRCRAGCGK